MIVGLARSGAIIQELTEAGLNVVALERAARCRTPIRMATIPQGR